MVMGVGVQIKLETQEVMMGCGGIKAGCIVGANQGLEDAAAAAVAAVIVVFVVVGRK